MQKVNLYKIIIIYYLFSFQIPFFNCLINLDILQSHFNSQNIFNYFFDLLNME